MRGVGGFEVEERVGLAVAGGGGAGVGLGVGVGVGVGDGDVVLLLSEGGCVCAGRGLYPILR